MDIGASAKLEIPSHVTTLNMQMRRSRCSKITMDTVQDKDRDIIIIITTIITKPQAGKLG